MIDCNGNSATVANTAPSTRDERAASILYVDNSNGEPSLMCATVNSKGVKSNGQPIITGVETFQVLYGTREVTAGMAPTVTLGITWKAPPTSPSWTEGPADMYLRADQLTVTSGSAAQNIIDTNANWRRVRSVRIGMILRGPPNSAQNTDTSTFYPFGRGKSSSGVPGSGFASTSDPGSAFVAPADGRLRQVLTFSVHLRNYQGL